MCVISNRQTVDARLKQGIELFHQGEYYECHEVLESLWRDTDPADKFRQAYQGIVQCAATMHLIEQKRYRGARKTYDKAVKNLEMFLQWGK